MAEAGTYVYCVVSAPRRPSLKGIPRGLPGTGPVRLLDVEGGRRPLWLAVSDAPLDRYGEDAINRGLTDLDWVSRRAVAHEAVVEAFISRAAVLPMKLFTIFTSDVRALEHVARERPRIDAILKRVANHVEWGVRVVLEQVSPKLLNHRTRAAAPRERSGAAFLSRKKAQRDASIELAERARSVVAQLYDRLSAQARSAKRRTATEAAANGEPLLLDAAFLVPNARSARFEQLAARQSRDLAREGYRVTVSGPWPAYSFIQE